MRCPPAKIMLALVAILLATGACAIEKTAPIVVEGKVCLTDFEKLNLNGQRMGCLIFTDTKSTFAVTFQNSNDGGPFFLCPSADPSTCAQSLATHPEVTSSQGDSAALVAFPPASFPGTLAGQNQFLAACAQLFATTQPTKPSCTNSKASEKADMKDCWFAFSLKYNYAANNIKCERWVP